MYITFPTTSFKYNVLKSAFKIYIKCDNGKRYLDIENTCFYNENTY